MIDPDLENFRIIPANKIDSLAVENMTKIEKQNILLKISIVIVVAALVFAVAKIIEDRQKENMTA
jgi:hypothetical protein